MVKLAVAIETVAIECGSMKMSQAMVEAAIEAAREAFEKPRTKGKEGKGQGGRVLPLLGRRVRMLVFLEPHVYMMSVSLYTASSCVPRTADTGYSLYT